MLVGVYSGWGDANGKEMDGGSCAGGYDGWETWRSRMGLGMLDVCLMDA